MFGHADLVENLRRHNYHVAEDHIKKLYLADAMPVLLIIKSEAIRFCELNQEPKITKYILKTANARLMAAFDYLYSLYNNRAYCHEYNNSYQFRTNIAKARKYLLKNIKTLQLITCDYLLNIHK